eukprot:11218141-Alexandrium_andersonii.AAC.1
MHFVRNSDCAAPLWLKVKKFGHLHCGTFTVAELWSPPRLWYRVVPRSFTLSQHVRRRSKRSSRTRA